MNNKNTRTLTGKLKKTILLAVTAMIVMWTLFYVGTRFLLSGYILKNMEKAAQHGIQQLNTSFLQMEEVNYAFTQEAEVSALFENEGGVAFHNAAAAAERRMQELIRGKNFRGSVILYRTDGFFYRVRGTISNTGIERLLYLVERQKEDYICVKLDNENYIGYIARLESGAGGVIMLMKETEIEEMLEKSGGRGIRFVLSAGDEIVASGAEIEAGTSLAKFRAGAEHIQSAQVGYTPFRLWVAYSGSDGRIFALFLAAMAVTALLLLVILRVFVQFWKKNFFLPIQMVIDEVQTFESGRERLLPLTGQEHFDGLIRGINEMTARIEAKDKALIVSLKKQIDAHFIFNILNNIQALSEMGESEKAGELCGGLSLLLRYTYDGESFIDGMEEFFMLQNYVGIMEIRYPNRFAAEIEMEDYLEDVRLPRMLLQPIVENSIVHGLIRAGQKGTVRVYAKAQGNDILYVVEDDGCGMSAEKLAELKERLAEAPLTEPEIEGLSDVALVNIERRIKSYFGGTYGLSVSSEQGKGTIVTVRLPKVR